MTFDLTERFQSVEMKVGEMTAFAQGGPIEEGDDDNGSGGGGSGNQNCMYWEGSTLVVNCGTYAGCCHDCEWTGLGNLNYCEWVGAPSYYCQSTGPGGEC